MSTPKYYESLRTQFTEKLNMHQQKLGQPIFNLTNDKNIEHLASANFIQPEL